MLFFKWYVGANTSRYLLFLLHILKIETLYTSSGSSSMGECDFVDKDKLILRGLQFHGFHGVKLEEKKLGQKFVIDVDAWMDLSNAGKSDDISDTVSYTAIYW